MAPAPTSGSERPRFVAAARDHGDVWIAGAILEADRRGRALRRVRQGASCVSERHPRVLLITIVDDGDVQAVEEARRTERAERRDDDDIAALHVDDAGAPCGRIVQSLEMLKGTARLEDRVEMPDQQELLTGSAMLGDQVAGAMERCTIDPLGGEAERIELRAQHVAHLVHAGEVHRAAVDLDQALEEGERAGVLDVDGAGEGAF
jgi:hypothetical protein